MPSVKIINPRFSPLTEDIICNYDLFRLVHYATVEHGANNCVHFIFRLSDDDEMILEEVCPCADKVLGINISEHVGKAGADLAPHLASILGGKLRKALRDNAALTYKFVAGYQGQDYGLWDVSIFPEGKRRLRVTMIDITPMPIEIATDRLLLPEVKAFRKLGLTI